MNKERTLSNLAIHNLMGNLHKMENELDGLCDQLLTEKQFDQLDFVLSSLRNFPKTSSRSAIMVSIKQLLCRLLLKKTSLAEAVSEARDVVVMHREYLETDQPLAQILAEVEKLLQFFAGSFLCAARTVGELETVLVLELVVLAKETPVLERVLRDFFAANTAEVFRNQLKNRFASVAVGSGKYTVFASDRGDLDVAKAVSALQKSDKRLSTATKRRRKDLLVAAENEKENTVLDEEMDDYEVENAVDFEENSYEEDEDTDEEGDEEEYDSNNEEETDVDEDTDYF